MEKTENELISRVRKVLERLDEIETAVKSDDCRIRTMESKICDLLQLITMGGHEVGIRHLDDWKA
jgi:hypothetical protein